MKQRDTTGKLLTGATRHRPELGNHCQCQPCRRATYDRMMTPKPREYGKCGECLMRDVEIVQLGHDGKCPKCGADYGK